MSGDEWGFAGRGEMAELLRATDWSRTPVGPVASWPPSLRAAVAIMLRSRFPMFLGWGPQLTMFYNDAYIPVLGGKHPGALGTPTQRVWGEIWDVLGPLAADVLAGGSTYAEDLLLVMQRAGFEEETYFTFSYSPIPGDDDGDAAAGLFCACTETTGRVVGERRLATLRALGEVSAVTAHTATQVCETATQVLARNRADVPFAAVYLPGPDGSALRQAATFGVQAGHPLAPAAVPAPSGGGSLWRAATTGEEVVTSGLAGRYPGGVVPDPGAVGSTAPDSAVVVPLGPGTPEAPCGVLAVGVSPYRPLDEDYRSFLRLVAGQLSAAITDARAYEDERARVRALAELDRAKTEFFANLSHEFRTPLTLIRGPVQDLLADDAPDVERVRAELSSVDRNAGRLARLVDDLLDFFRAQAGRARARYEPVDLAVVTADLASMFRSAVQRAGLTLAVDCVPGGEPVAVDREMWEKIVLNLLSNALKFTESGGITVAVRAAGRHVELTVGDTGIGIPAAELPRLFDRFHRVAGDRGRSAEGSGIGLALVRELVELHGGSVEVDSRVGAGSTFTVRLPLGTAHLPAEHLPAEHLAPEHLPPEPLSDPDRPATGAVARPYIDEALRWLPSADGTAGDPATGSGPATVLVVDDNADMREYLTRLLAAHYRVRTAGDGRAALEVVRAEVPDLVVTDVMMPRLDGFGLLAALRDDPATGSVPVIVLSARAGPESTIDGLAAGADDYLAKPFTAGELLARVGSQLELARGRSREAVWRSTLIGAMQDAFYVVDLDADPPRVVELNDAYEEILGYGRAGLPYPAPFPWWPDPDTHPAERREVERSLAAGTSGRLTLPVRHRDGHLVWAAITFATLTDPTTGRRMRVGTLRDVTEDRLAAVRARELADEQLQEADRAFRLLTEHSDDVVGRHDPDGTWRYVSPSVHRMTGWLPEQLVGRHPLDLVHPDDLDATRVALTRVADGPAEVRLRFRRADGTYLWVEARGRPVTDPETGAVELQTVSRDIHARVLAEEELARFRDIAERTSDFVGIADARTGLAVYVNPAGRALVGIGPDDDVGAMPVTDFVVDPAVVAVALSTVARDGLWSGETDFVHRDGTPIPMSQVVTAHRGPRGELDHVSTIARDLRAQRRAAAETHAERERYRALVEQVDVGIYRTAADGSLVFVNDRYRHLMGGSADELAGRRWLERVHPDDRDRVAAAGAAAAAARRSWTDEYRVRTAPGEVRRVTSSAQPLHDAEGAFAGYLGTCVDVTALHDAAEDRRRLAAEQAAHAATEAAADRLQTLVSGLDAVVWEADARSLEIGFMSDRIVEMLGYPLATWLGSRERWIARVHPDDRARVVAVVDTALARGRNWQQTYRMISADSRVVSVQSIVHVEPDEHGRAARLQGVLVDVTERERQERANALLVRIGALQVADRLFGEKLAELVEAAAPLLGELSVLALLGPDGLLRTVAVAAPEHPDAAAAQRRLPPAAIPPSLADRLETGRAFVLPGTGEAVLREVCTDAQELRDRLAVGLHDRLVVPLTGDDQVLGVLTFVSISRSRTTDGFDLALAEELGRRVTAMVQAHEALRREERLRQITADLAAAATVADVADVLMTALVETFGAVGQNAYVVDAEKGVLTLVRAEGYATEIVDRFATIPLDAHTPLCDAARTREPVWLRDHDDWTERYPQLRAEHDEFGYRAALVLPLRGGDGRAVAVIAASFDTARTFPPAERAFALTLAGTAAQAAERALEADRSRTVAEALQHSLLPDSPPIVDRLAVATRYLPGAAGVQAGGDWYDVIALDAHRTAIVVGDVVGQGAAAAAVMGQLRTALSTLLLADAATTPAAALAHLNLVAARTPGARASTAICLILDTAAERLCWAGAGHPPPLLVTAEGRTRYLDAGAGPLLGVVGLDAPIPGPYTDGELAVAPGDTVVLYTDGLIERRGEIVDQGLERLRTTAGTTAAAGPAALASSLLAAAVPETGGPTTTSRWSPPGYCPRPCTSTGGPRGPPSCAAAVGSSRPGRTRPPCPDGSPRTCSWSSARPSPTPSSTPTGAATPPARSTTRCAASTTPPSRPPSPTTGRGGHGRPTPGTAATACG